MHKSPDDSTLTLPPAIGRITFPLLVGGPVLLVLGMILGSAVVGLRFAMSVYLAVYMFCLTISLGALFFVLIQHLCRAGWSASLRRIAELLMAVIPALAVLFIPILVTFFGTGVLYVWTDPGFAEHHHLDPNVWDAKTSYLNWWFFTIRAIAYFAIWIALARYYFNQSRRQDETGEIELTEAMQWWSGPAVMLFSLSVTFAAFDWIMSLAPMWFSTIFGVYLFAGSMVACLCTITALLYWFQSQGRLREEVTVEHYHDLGKLTFGFLVFWTYIAFSQYFLIWYGNIPEETEWFQFRQDGGWVWVSLMLVFFHWMLPFLGLLSRHVRRRPQLMFGWSIYLLVMHFVDVYWMIVPEVRVGVLGGFFGALTTLLCLSGMIALYLGVLFKQAEGVPLMAVRDPRLPEALAFHNV